MISEKGYRRIRVDGRYQMEHVVVWEEAYGPIPEGFCLHHRNGDKLDNRLENLELMAVGQHTAYHKLGKPSPLRGCSLPLEVRAKIAASLLGRTPTQETRAKMSRAHWGRKAAQETRDKMRVSQRRRRLRERMRRTR